MAEQTVSDAVEQDESSVNVEQVELPEAADKPSPDGAGLNMLMDLSMKISVRLGEADIPLKRLSQLGPGSVLSLEKNINDPVELFVQDIKFATGEVVTVDGFFAVRVKEVIGL